MSLDNRLKSLEQRHAKTEEQIHRELIRPSADPVTITTLKREKLRLKDEMRSMHA
jgi:hypothetical protein